ncbi:hypothetical protein EQO05_11490 [Methanosarcina sp. MSH10X1]|nr:hypothetical protein EQO05_11490 [Methanosarcina sp. MSH10X1]
MCLVLTTLPAALGASSESLAYVSEENTMVTDEWIINDTIAVDSAEQKIKADNATVVNVQINPESK